jgi:hypothetical protein
VKYRYHEDGTLPQRADTILVFGSHILGRHGKGAAKVARGGQKKTRREAGSWGQQAGQQALKSSSRLRKSSAEISPE